MSIQKEQGMKFRGGVVLRNKNILKSEFHPGSQKNHLKPNIDGAPNYHQADTLRVHGVAIPTFEGILNVLKHVGARSDGTGSHVLWINLREERVVYINGRPFVLRDVGSPYYNLEYTGISRTRLEEMESRLKADVLVEAARYENKFLVADELPSGQMVDQWETISHDSVKTPLQVYEELKSYGYHLDYERVPEMDFDILVNKISQVDIDTTIIFNCQMGHGRTTTGMVIATLIYYNRAGASGIPMIESIGRVSEISFNVTDHKLGSDEAIRSGEYAVIRSLVRVLEGGAEGKKQVDKVIDKCASMQNLREAIATHRNSIPWQQDEMRRETALSYFVEYLEKYYFFICFAVYLHTQIYPYENSFSSWMKARPALYSILQRFLIRDPMGALGYQSEKACITKMEESANGRPSEIGIVAARRTGEILSPHTVLKNDHCPGYQKAELPDKVEGAPNFRKVHGFPVYGVASPTIDGIRSVIQRVGGSSDRQPVLWHNMREEPVIYINGKPFVLREVERPYKNMLEDTESIEKMEDRLKDDILREAKHYKGAIMVIHETDDGEIFDAWEHVHEGSILTPLEVFERLEEEGYEITYARVPITYGIAPKSSDFETLAVNIVCASEDTAFVFNCQTGIGRTTTGTVIACLVKVRMAHGLPLRFMGEHMSTDEPDRGYSSFEDISENEVPSTSNINNMVEPDISEMPPLSFGFDVKLLLRKTTGLFKNGDQCRKVLDAIINQCSALQNIREGVLHYRRMFSEHDAEDRVKRVDLIRAAEYLEGYFILIAYAAYLGSELGLTFKMWLHQRPEVEAIKWSIRLMPGRLLNVPPAHVSVQPREPVDTRLVFCIDLADYDDIRHCCFGANACAGCTHYIDTATRLVDKALREHFGFHDIFWEYDGQSSVHCWVSDRKVRRLSNDQRTLIASYLGVNRGRRFQGHKAHAVLMKTLSKYPKILHQEMLESVFEKSLLIRQNILATEDGFQKLLHMIPDKQMVEEFCMSCEQSAKNHEDISLSRWKQLKKKMLAKNLGELVQHIVYSYTYPRLNVKVTQHESHVPYSPYCAHLAKGRLCVPLDPKTDFDFTKISNFVLDELGAWNEDPETRQPHLEEADKYLCFPNNIWNEVFVRLGEGAVMPQFPLYEFISKLDGKSLARLQASSYSFYHSICNVQSIWKEKFLARIKQTDPEKYCRVRTPWALQYKRVFGNDETKRVTAVSIFEAEVVLEKIIKREGSVISFSTGQLNVKAGIWIVECLEKTMGESTEQIIEFKHVEYDESDSSIVWINQPHDRLEPHHDMSYLMRAGDLAPEDEWTFDDYIVVGNAVYALGKHQILGVFFDGPTSYAEFDRFFQDKLPRIILHGSEDQIDGIMFRSNA